MQTRKEAKARAEALRPIFTELEGQSARAIAAELNRRGVARQRRALLCDHGDPRARQAEGLSIAPRRGGGA